MKSFGEFWKSRSNKLTPDEVRARHDKLNNPDSIESIESIYCGFDDSQVMYRDKKGNPKLTPEADIEVHALPYEEKLLEKTVYTSIYRIGSREITASECPRNAGVTKDVSEFAICQICSFQSIDFRQ